MTLHRDDPVPVVSPAMTRPIVAVLAGGESRRMGSDKAHTAFGAGTMLQTVLEVAAEIGDPVVVGRTDAPLGTPALADRRSDARGPLAGLETALRAFPGRTIALLAVDHPFVRAATISELLAAEGAAVVPVDEGWEQVTCAVYRPGFADAASATLDSGDRSLITALGNAAVTLVDEATWRAWGEDGRSWFSVDSPERLAEGRRRYGEEPSLR
jgi:molybdopterin-guanine dinucleotide biosynthesis protein A